MTDHQMMCVYMMDYWDDEIRRSQNYIYKCQEEIRNIKEEMNHTLSEGWDG